MAENFKETNENTEEGATQPTDEKRESRSLDCRKPRPRQNKNRILQDTKKFEGTYPTIRYQIPKQKCSRKLATIITTVNQEILPEYLKYKVTNFLGLHITIYAAAVATVRLSGARMYRQIKL